MSWPVTSRLTAAIVGTAVGVAAVVAPLTAPGAGAHQASRGGEHPLLAAADDDPDDVRLTKAEGLEDEDRRSVELKKLVVTDRGRKVRFDLRLERVDRSQEFVQVYLFDIESKELPWSQMIVATMSMTEPPDPHGIEHSTGIEFADGPQGFVSCDHLTLRLRDGASRLWVEVPRRCIPRGPVALKVYAQTVDGVHAQLRQMSHDTLRVPGRHDLGGTARPDES